MPTPRGLTTIAVSDLVCPRCEARLKESCKTLAGEVTTTHSSRLDPLREAFANGYEAAGGTPSRSTRDEG